MQDVASSPIDGARSKRSGRFRYLRSIGSCFSVLQHFKRASELLSPIGQSSAIGLYTLCRLHDDIRRACFRPELRCKTSAHSDAATEFALGDAKQSLSRLSFVQLAESPTDAKERVLTSFDRGTFRNGVV